MEALLRHVRMMALATHVTLGYCTADTELVVNKGSKQSSKTAHFEVPSCYRPGSGSILFLVAALSANQCDFHFLLLLSVILLAVECTGHRQR